MHTHIHTLGESRTFLCSSSKCQWDVLSEWGAVLVHAVSHALCVKQRSCETPAHTHTHTVLWFPQLSLGSELTCRKLTDKRCHVTFYHLLLLVSFGVIWNFNLLWEVLVTTFFFFVSGKPCCTDLHTHTWRLHTSTTSTICTSTSAAAGGSGDGNEAVLLPHFTFLLLN